MLEHVLALLLGVYSPGNLACVPSPSPAVSQAAGAPDAATAAANLSRPAPAVEDVAKACSAVQHTTEADGARRQHRFVFPDGTCVEFSDRPRSRGERARRPRVLAFEGTQSAAAEPAATFETAGQAAGLAPEAVSALRFVSGHEGGFDAINTWDSARFSWGFVQFAGGRGLRPLLAHLKMRKPELFAAVLGAYGVDVCPGEDGEPVPVYVDPASGKVLRGKAAEQAYGDHPLTIAAFIRAGRLAEIKQLQVEAAMAQYARAALEVRYQGVAFGQVVRSAKGIAMLIDRKVHEGNLGRFRRALDVVGPANPGAPAPVAAELEARLLEQVLTDAAASEPMIQGRLRNIWISELRGPAAPFVVTARA